MNISVLVFPLYTSDAADEQRGVSLGCTRIKQKKKHTTHNVACRDDTGIQYQRTAMNLSTKHLSVHNTMTNLYRDTKVCVTGM